MMEKTYKIPVGAEEAVDNMVKMAVERYLRLPHEVIVENKPEYRQAVDSFLADNNMELKYSKVKVDKVEVLEDEIIEP
jgi:hypothetical protein